RERLTPLLREMADGASPPRAAGLRVPRFDAPLVAAALEAVDEAAGDESWETLRRALADFGGVAPQPLPAGLCAELRPYQRRGYDWLCFLRQWGFHGILADEMGLGKTLQALAAVLATREDGSGPMAGSGRPSLVVAPTSLVFNWMAEAARFAPSLRVLPLVGPGRQRLFAQLDRCDLALTTYALLRRDLPALAEVEFEWLILDEAQHIKNPASDTARAARSLRARHRLALTGTPVENDLRELWSLFAFLMPGWLGSLEAFTARYGRGSVPSAQPAAEEGDGLARLRRRIRPFVLRRTKADVLPDLPPRTDTVVTCEFGPAQRRLYQEVLDTYRARVLRAVDEQGLARSRLVVLDALLRLRQVCCDPRLLKLPGNRVRASAKLELFRDLVQTLVGEGERVLVFSQFVEMLSLLRQELDELHIPYEVLHGRTRDREGVVRRFQEGSAPVFLISLRAGGTGLNLTAASYVIHYDPWWNPAVEDQATGRAHRIGQSRPVFSYKLVARGTVEEKVLQLQERKRALFEGLFAGGGSFARELTREDLEALF
ncbi:MAG: DEAD/DEAH box helicase, partial [Clostridia bacterium]|nr:DEAD/DEAH box helicase [Clostridia bacterium]